ncbi:hypothetical protein JMJ77_0000818 [Colletotrichum scovillei]|uniref:Uncharacterized protein n=1 Tax=Colletotrichum scovillei TaxID=1209932 RepID=A0A9P7RAD0_9PEZI|nr:hypothetical protein JMJ77_0000818 [Colletotrichum scovillei]KAG7072032.1 hypothetical protein JMJ76_0004894 [Colletotrichum scovillei]KAG7080210.1 hypothetical protein JMJ78_0007310 [Colletotrichum scovillei]
MPLKTPNKNLELCGGGARRETQKVTLRQGPVGAMVHWLAIPFRCFGTVLKICLSRPSSFPINLTYTEIIN